MKFKFTSILGLIGLLVCLSMPAEAIVIKCGITSRGDPVDCDLDSNRCWRCEKDGWQRFWERAKGALTGNPKQNFLYYETERVTYQCTSKGLFNIAKGCVETQIGGLSGRIERTILGFKAEIVSGEECVVENIKKVYTSSCYSCQIVETLGKAFIRAGASAYQVSRSAANAILVLGALLWAAFFALKTVSSFTTVEPMKVLQELMTQLFKIFVAFVIVNAGIETILHYTLEPLMLAGTDFADTIIVSSAGTNPAQAEKIGQLMGGGLNNE